MSDTLKYLDYQGSVEYSAEDRIFYGQVLMIDSLIAYQGSSVDELESSFIAAVDDYLTYCKSKGIEPNKAYKGTFNVRPGPEIHRALAQAAIARKTTLNDVVKLAFNRFLEEDRKVIINNHFHSSPNMVVESSAKSVVADWKGTTGDEQWLPSTLTH